VDLETAYRPTDDPSKSIRKSFYSIIFNEASAVNTAGCHNAVGLSLLAELRLLND
jgi:hypothetical protein